jgi:hypothetical protein
MAERSGDGKTAGAEQQARIKMHKMLQQVGTANAVKHYPSRRWYTSIICRKWSAYSSGLVADSL